MTIQRLPFGCALHQYLCQMQSQWCNILSVFNQILEKLMYKRLKSFINMNDIFMDLERIVQLNMQFWIF